MYTNSECLPNFFTDTLLRRQFSEETTLWVGCFILFAPSPPRGKRRPLYSTLTLERRNMASSHCNLVLEQSRRKYPSRYLTDNDNTMVVLIPLFGIFQTHLSEYTALTHALVNHTTRKGGAYVRKWGGELPPMAQKFLEHYAVLNDIDELQQTCM